MRLRIVIGAIATSVFVGAAFPAQNQAARSLSPADVNWQIHSAGAKATLTRLYNSAAWSTSVLPGIGRASPSWIRVAEQLKQAADGAAAEDLDIALLFDALSSAPLRVLPELSRIYGKPVEEICHVSFEAELPKPDVATYLRSVRTKLGMARSAHAREMASACRRGLELTEADARAQGVL